MSKKNMEIGFQVSSIRDFVTTPEGLMESFAKIREIGYRTVQLQYIAPEVPAQAIQDALMKNNLTCVGTQDDYDQSLLEIESIIAKNKLCGGTYVCSAIWPLKYLKPEGYALFTEEMDRAGALVEESGLIFTYHPLFLDLTPLDGITPVDYLLQHSKTKLQLTLDLYHVIRAGLDPVATIEKYAGKMDIIHFKDSKKTPSGEDVTTPIGQGETNWPPIVQACLNAGIKYCFIEQETCEKDPFVCMKESHMYVTDLVKRFSAAE